MSVRMRAHAFPRNDGSRGPTRTRQPKARTSPRKPGNFALARPRISLAKRTTITLPRPIHDDFARAGAPRQQRKAEPALGDRPRSP